MSICKSCGHPKDEHMEIGEDLVTSLLRGGPVLICPTALYVPTEPEVEDEKTKKSREFLAKIFGAES